MKKLIQTLWCAFLFTFPFSLHFLAYEKASYRFGNFNPWVSGFIYLPEILLILTFLLWFYQNFKEKTLPKLKYPNKGLILFILFILNAALVTFTQGDPILFGFYLFHTVVAVIAYGLIRARIVPYSQTVTWLLYGAVFQILIGYIQTRLNGSVGLPIIGEPNIGPEVLNVAKIDLPSGEKLVRPYGTFLHPNILGAYVMAILFIALPYLKKVALPFWVILLTIGIYFTASQAAQLATVLTFGLLFMLGMLKKPIHKRWFSLVVLSMLLLGNAWFFVNSSRVDFQAPSLVQRLEQNVISLDMFLNNTLGVGVSNFTLEMENFADQKLMPWEFQPVHNGYYLILNETGIQGLIILSLIIAYLLHKYWREDLEYDLQMKARILPLFALLIILSFDHLLLTSYVGPLLIAFVLAETTHPV